MIEAVPAHAPHAAHLLQSAAQSGLAVPAALFLSGLTGGAVHCAGMCGPFVLAQVSAGVAGPRAAGSRLTRLRGAVLLPYHLGRGTTYVALGALAGGLAGGISGLASLRSLGAVLLGLAALAFLAQALARALPGASAPGAAGAAVARLLGRFAGPLLERAESPAGRYGLGLVLGFLPCGLLYGALAAAAGTGDLLSGGLAMGAFTLGTAPALVGVGFAGHFALGRAGARLRWLYVGLLVANGVWLGYLAWQALP